MARELLAPAAMPSSVHEAFVAILRELPRQLVEWLPADVAGVLDARRATVLDKDVPQLVPPARSCDLAIRIPLRRPIAGAACAGVIVEIQLRCDPCKDFAWPMYWATLRASLRGPVWLVVITTRRATERWAAAVLRKVLLPGQWLVLGPSTIERVVDPAVARREPERAIVSAIVHAGREDDDLVPAVAAACSTRSDSHGMLMQDVIMQRLGPAARRALEAVMLKGYVWKSDFAIKHRAAGREEGRKEGREEVLEFLATLRRSLLGMIADRRLALSDRHRRSVAACTDPDRLLTWASRVATASRASQIFAPLPKSRAHTRRARPQRRA